MADAHADWVAELLGDIDAGSCEELSQLLHDARLAIRSRAEVQPEGVNA